jgi:hypothetical protein
MAGGGLRTPEEFAGLDNDAPIRHAINEIYANYGDVVSVEAKQKSLNKFGRNLTVGTSFETVAVFQSTTANETFVSTNLIDSISSSNETADRGIGFTIEGHTIDVSGNLTFVTQNATLDATDARTKVTLSTPLARATRAYVRNSGTFDSPFAVPTGTIYIYDDTDGITAGVPDTAAATKLIIDATETQTEKCATAISQTDYWIVTEFGAGIGQGGGNAAAVTLRMEARDVANGGVWRPLGRDIVLVVDQQNPPDFPVFPYRIVPKSHDWRVRAKCDANTASVFAEASGFLAFIVG